jgi:hypothetical protein
VGERALPEQLADHLRANYQGIRIDVRGGVTQPRGLDTHGIDRCFGLCGAASPTPQPGPSTIGNPHSAPHQPPQCAIRCDRNQMTHRGN